MYIIGITGGVGSGKTALLDYIGEHYNCRILLSDEASHKVMQPGGAAYRDLVSLLNQYPADPSIESASDPLLNPDGSISHKEMAARIFADKNLLEQVNAIIHPAVRVYIMNAIREEQEKSGRGADGAVDYFFLEAALLIEEGYNTVVDEMWYIYCDYTTRVQRLKKNRGYSDAKISSIMAAQLSEDQFRRGSDVVIDNSGDFEIACRQIDRQMERIRSSVQASFRRQC